MAPRTYPPYLREKARQLRRDRKLTIDELAECLALPRTTIYYWVRDLPIPRTTRQSAGQRRGNRAMRKKYERLRDAAYAEGRDAFADLIEIASFRDFVVLYIAEGTKRRRNEVALTNSDPAVVRLAAHWIRGLCANKISYSIRYHADQDPDELRAFWGVELAIDPSSISLSGKSNSNGLAGRTWRSKYGVLEVRANDTPMRAHASRRGWIAYESNG
jgi:hypothetical protein